MSVFIVDFFRENGLVDPQQKNDGLPPLANLIFVSPPPHTYINVTIYQT